MPSTGQRLGVPSILLSVDSTVVVPAMSGVSFSVCAITPNDFLYNDVNTVLSPTDTYQVAVGLVGRESVGTGYTVGVTTISSGNVAISTANQGLEVTILNANWPANFQYAICAAIFLKINAGNWQIAQFAYIPASTDFTTVISAKPLTVASSWAYATLIGAVTDPIMGSRNGLGVTYSEITPTTGTFNFRRPVSNITVSPNTGADYQITTTRSSGIQFTSLINDVKTFVRAAAGEYTSYTYAGATRKEAQYSLNTARALLRGNRPVQVVMPPDPADGTTETRLLLGTLGVNQIELTEAWSKSATTPVSFQFDAASLDTLVTNAHTEISYSS